MKKIFTFAALLMTVGMFADNAEMPMTVPGKPNMDASKVQAVMCDFYANNLAFAPQSWGKAATPDTLGQTHMYYYSQASWDAFTNWGASNYDVSGYAKLHLDVWVSEATSQIKIKIEALSTNDGGSGYSHSYTYPIGLMKGWNELNIDLATAYSDYDFKDLKYIMFEGLQDETKPMSFANILFYNDNYTCNEPEEVKREEKFPADAPTALPTGELPEDAVAILGTGIDSTLKFSSVDWGCAWKEYTLADKTNKILYCSNMTWEAFTNWAQDSYDLSDYNTLVVELFPAVKSSIKVTIEALKEAEGGQEGDFKNGVVVDSMPANEWTVAKIPFEKFKYATDSTKIYNFADVKYLILEGYSNEGTMLTIGRVYVCKESGAGVENLNATEQKAVKCIENGKMVIIRNGVKFNALGAQL